jgi:hypothetical protein
MSELAKELRAWGETVDTLYGRSLVDECAELIESQEKEIALLRSSIDRATPVIERLRDERDELLLRASLLALPQR